MCPTALTCEPSPGPSISPAAAATRQSGGGGPLASPPQAFSTPTSSCDSASTASLARALRRQSASEKPIPVLLSAGGGTLALPGRLVENCESEATPTPRPRPAHAGAKSRWPRLCTSCPGRCPPVRTPHPAASTGPGSGCYSNVNHHLPSANWDLAV